MFAPLLVLGLVRSRWLGCVTNKSTGPTTSTTQVQGQTPAKPTRNRCSSTSPASKHELAATTKGGVFQYVLHPGFRSTMVVLHQQQNNHRMEVGFHRKTSLPTSTRLCSSTTNFYEIHYPYESPSTPSSSNSLLLTEPTMPQPTDWCPVDHNHDIRFWSGRERTSSKGGDLRRSSKGGFWTEMCANNYRTNGNSTTKRIQRQSQRPVWHGCDDDTHLGS